MIISPGLRTFLLASLLTAVLLASASAAFAQGTLVTTIDVSTWNGVVATPILPSPPPPPYPGFSLTSLAFDPVLKTLYAADSNSSIVYQIDTTTNTIKAAVNTQGGNSPIGSFSHLTAMADPTTGRWAVMGAFGGAKFTASTWLFLDSIPGSTMPLGAVWDSPTNTIYSGATNFFAVKNQKFLTGGFACAGTTNTAALNSVTVRAYASCGFSDSNAGVYIYDGLALQKANGKITTPPIASALFGAPHRGALGLAANPNTNRIYAAALSNPTSLDVLDGGTYQLLASIPGISDQTTSVHTSAVIYSGTPLAQPVAVNSQTNTIFVLNSIASTISVFDGNTNTLKGTLVIPIPAGAVMDNPVGEPKIGNTIYDGIRAVPTTLGGAVSMAVNEATNTLYVASVNGTISVFALDPATVPTTYSVSGVVKDALGVVQSNLTVTSTGASGTSTAVTDAQGLFVFTGLASGAYTITPIGPNGVVYTAQAVTVASQSIGGLTFSPAANKPVTLSVSRSNTGTVTASPAGLDHSLDCGNACSAKYNPNTVVTLTATPPLGKTFNSWGGACSGTATTCTITITKDTTVKATFNK